MFFGRSKPLPYKTRYDINLVASATYRVACNISSLQDISKISQEIYIDALLRNAIVRGKSGKKATPFKGFYTEREAPLWTAVIHFVPFFRSSLSLPYIARRIYMQCIAFLEFKDYFSSIAKAARIPSTAALTIPPAYPAPSPAG